MGARGKHYANPTHAPSGSHAKLPEPALSLAVDPARPNELTAARFELLATQAGLKFRHTDHFVRSYAKVERWHPAGEMLVWRNCGHGMRDVLFCERDGSLVHVDLDRHRGRISVAAQTKKRATQLWRELVGWLGQEEAEVDPDAVKIRTWSKCTYHGGATDEDVTRVVPAWGQVAANYPSEVGDLLEQVAAWQRGFPTGRIMVWHGPPGTGKTRAIQTLAREWRSWCGVEVVLDPENLLGSDLDYARSLLSARRMSGCTHRLLVLEDAGELIGVDARGAVGQALSRLLNFTDGIAAPDNLAILITTNEPVSKLHPAILRPGRCIHSLELRPHTAGEAAAWLDQHAPPDAERPSGSCTLAELYAISRGEHGFARTQPELGFATA
jgi:hypothetical protein